MLATFILFTGACFSETPRSKEFFSRGSHRSRRSRSQRRKSFCLPTLVLFELQLGMTTKFQLNAP